MAAPGAVVTVGNARFTVLTDRLIRMEWAADATSLGLMEKLPVKCGSLQEPSDVLGILVVPGAGKSTFRLYEDDGVSKDYAGAFTLIEKNRSGKHLTLTVHPREGSFTGALTQRNLYLVLEGVTAVPSKVLLNGAQIGECKAEGTGILVTLPSVPADELAVIEVIF